MLYEKEKKYAKIINLNQKLKKSMWKEERKIGEGLAKN